MFESHRPSFKSFSRLYNFFEKWSSYSLTSLSSCVKLLNVVAQDDKNIESYFLQWKYERGNIFNVVEKQRLTFENWTKKTNQMCRDFILVMKKQQFLISLKRYNKSVIKMSFQSSWKFKFFMRVWSWLRTNAGGVPNTCKSNESDRCLHWSI